MKKLDPQKKMKLIYSGELLLFAVIFLVFAILKLTVMEYKETRRIIFNWITIFGGTWGIIDLVWGLASKKRRQRISLLDKFLILPLALFIITFDFICLIGPKRADTFYVYCVSAAFFYISAIYLFEGIYHYYKPIPGLLDDDEEEEKKVENSQEKPENSEEKPEN